MLLWLAYSGGHGVPKDAKQGLPYLREAAEQGSLESQWVPSTMYEFGRGGLPVNHAESFKWALKAAQRGHMVTQHNVATAYFHGLGVEENLEQARYWYGRAAEQGFAHSEWMLGRIYFEGLGVPANRDEAVKWLSKSLVQGHVPPKSDESPGHGWMLRLPDGFVCDAQRRAECSVIGKNPHKQNRLVWGTCDLSIRCSQIDNGPYVVDRRS